MKYILVTGGVISGIGKGIVTSSIGALLKAHGFKVSAIKIDPYINIDAGTFSPYEHGEVFVLNDGCEVDLDLGNYERFLDTDLAGSNNITTGKVYQRVIDRERRGDYLGKTVQIVPHITDAIQQWIEETATGDICLIELGGVIGDIEGMPFIEALRQLKRKVKHENFCCCHVSLVPWNEKSKEFKSKPTQQSVDKLTSFKLYPDMIVCRSQVPITDMGVKDKISNFCEVEIDNIFNLPDLDTIYSVPIEMHHQGVIKAIARCLNLETNGCNPIQKWVEIRDIALNSKNEIIIALVGKYTTLGDCYTSVVKSLEHACYDIGCKPKINYIDSSHLESKVDNEAWQLLKKSHCLLVPGGFGKRGAEGKIAAIRWARENKLPFLGICLGFQMATVEYARSIAGLKHAHSAEFEPECPEPIVIEMLEYLDAERKLGGTMRLGLRNTKFVTKDSILRKLYGEKDMISERHRHRYEINPDFIEILEKSGLKFVGKNEDGSRMEILELDRAQHPYFVAVQYHPEYLSRPFRPSPPYKGLVEAGRVIQTTRDQ